MKSVVTFGEIMGRLTPPGCLRLRQSMPGNLEVTFAGAEANVAGSLAMLGMQATFVTALPKNELADACVASLAAAGVVTEIARTGLGRLGLYFLETGANQRPSRVLYDRDHSAISLASPEVFHWPSLFSDADWFHVTGITPAISESAAQATIESVRAAKKAGLTVSCDLNFRAKILDFLHLFSDIVKHFGAKIQIVSKFLRFNSALKFQAQNFTSEKHCRF